MGSIYMCVCLFLDLGGFLTSLYFRGKNALGSNFVLFIILEEAQIDLFFWKNLKELHGILLNSYVNKTVSENHIGNRLM